MASNLTMLTTFKLYAEHTFFLTQISYVDFEEHYSLAVY